MVQDSNAWNRFTPPISDYESGSGSIGSKNTASEGFFSTRSADGKIIPTRSNILHDYNLYNYNFTLFFFENHAHGFDDSRVCSYTLFRS